MTQSRRSFITKSAVTAALGFSHMVASFLGAMAACHVCASVPNFMILEWQIYFHKDPMFKEIVTFDDPIVTNSFIQLSEKPGVGVEINEEGMRKYATPGIPFFV